MLSLVDKQAIVAQVQAVASRSSSAIAAHYRGLTVEDMTALRVKTREKGGINMQVVRNTLARRALTDTPFSAILPVLKGPVVLFFSDEEPGAAARVIRDFVKENEKLVVQGLVLDGQLLPPEQLKAVADLPSRDEAIAQVMSVMQGPITQCVRTVHETYAQLVRVMGAVKDKLAA